MAREINRLNARAVTALSRPGRHADGGGLYLSISTNGGRRWVYLFRRNGKMREMGLGSASTVTLARARELASAARDTVSRGLDPIETRDLHGERSKTFSECSALFIEDNKSGWSNAKHADQWANTLKTYADPVIGRMAVADITTTHIIKILNPIWTTKTETASRVRSRIEAVLDWARVHGLREGENPARWRGHLDQLLPKRSKVARVQHHPALPFMALPDFLIDLRTMEGVAPLALEFTILTAARTNETIGATVNEFTTGTWIIPGERMTGGREHRVPLAPRSLAILEALGIRLWDNRDEPAFDLSNGAMLAVLDRMGRGDITVHGFRSTFRDWASETTPFPNEVVEMALAHSIPNKSEAAYRRGDLFDKRRALMNLWADYCGGVVPSAPLPELH
jgi:integrase